MTLIVEHCLSAPGGDLSCQSLEATSPETTIFMTDKLCYTNVYLDSKYFFHVHNMISFFQTRRLDCSGKYHHHHHWLYSCGWALASSVVNIGTLFYLTTYNILHSDSFAWWLAVQHSLLSYLTGEGVHTFWLKVL